MSTITTLTDKRQAIETEKCYVVKHEEVLDYSTTNAISGDVVQVMDIPANSFVSNVLVKVVTAETGTLIVGDGADTNGWCTAVDASSTGVNIADGAFASAGGKYYSAADTIDVICAASNMDSGKIAVSATITQLEN